jgi:hypothetical protein
MHATATNSLEIEPYLWPRNASDAAIGLAVAGAYHLVIIAVALVPASLVKLATDSTWAAVATLAATLFLLYFLQRLFTVRKLRFDEHGIEFVTLIGHPGKIPWASVQSVEEAPQHEVVMQGWLRPRFPLREMTDTATSIGHYRIRWQGGVAYFPPRDVDRFLYAMQVGWQYHR